MFLIIIENSLLKSKLNKIEDLSSFQLREQESEHLKQLEELRSIQEMERNKLETRIEILMLDLKRMSESALFTDTTLINSIKSYLKYKIYFWYKYLININFNETI